jgi:hypothetical protein
MLHQRPEIWEILMGELLNEGTSSPLDNQDNCSPHDKLLRLKLKKGVRYVCPSLRPVR